MKTKVPLKWTQICIKFFGKWNPMMHFIQGPPNPLMWGICKKQCQINIGGPRVYEKRPHNLGGYYAHKYLLGLKSMNVHYTSHNTIRIRIVLSRMYFCFKELYYTTLQQKMNGKKWVSKSSGYAFWTNSLKLLQHLPTI